jgi:DNA-binding response OmpR family regulator
MDVLLIEDENKIADFVIEGFAVAGMRTHHEADGFRGLTTALMKRFDAIVMDVSMPLMDGFEVLAELRKSGVQTPVIMLTARTDLEDRLRAFQTGADDYLAKPFFIEELIVRIKKITHQKVFESGTVITQSGISLDRFTRIVKFKNRSATLTQREFVLLECLMLSPGQIFTRQQILKRAWNVDFDPGTNLVDVCIQRLRKKISDADFYSVNSFPLETIRGVGYRLNIEP